MAVVMICIGRHLGKEIVVEIKNAPIDLDHVLVKIDASYRGIVMNFSNTAGTKKLGGWGVTME